VYRDIVTSKLPHWDNTRLWVLSRPLSGFAETFSQYIMEVSPGGGSERPESDPGAEGVLCVVEGEMVLTISSAEHRMAPGGYAFIPPGSDWQLRNGSDATVPCHWIRKADEKVDSIEVPEAFVVNENDIEPSAMHDCNEAWATTRFVDPEEMR